MAQVNGHVEAQEKKALPAPYLGKRKRTDSQEPEVLSAPNSASAEYLENAIQIMRRYEASEKFLVHPLARRDDNEHATKRQRIEPLNSDENNIQYRIRNGCYRSLNEFMEDAAEVKATISKTMPTTNGTTDMHTPTEEQVNAMWEDLVNYQAKLNNSGSPGVEEDRHHSSDLPPSLPQNLVLSLRSQTEQGIRQLFSGLAKESNAPDIQDRRLPNGFELAEVSSMEKSNPPERQDRKFGDVFAPHRTIKTLEIPRTNRTSRGHKLEFIPPFENVPNSNRNDFRYANLSTGSWLKYATTDKSTLDIRKRSRDTASTANALFKATFSSFAPTSDNASAAVTASDRSRQWWRKYCRPSLNPSIWDDQAESTEEVQGELDNIDFEKELEMLIANYVAEDSIVPESEQILDEVSELIETLSSYQTMRDLEIARGPASASKPSKEELSTYELLRDQIQILVSSLPPFAIAKLDGDQLENLNISTHILIAPPEVSGTAQMDDHTLKRNRAAQAAVSAASRSAAPTPNRSAYGTPATTYNVQARAYNASMPGSAYVGRPAAPIYNTIRPGTGNQSTPYTPNSYRPTVATIHTPSIQQFQRPMTNGYGSSPVNTPQVSYIQRPSQPGYQQKAQESGQHNRSESPHKPMVNGQAQQYQQRQYTPMHNTYTNTIHNTTSQRQTSGTPQPASDSTEKPLNASQPVKAMTDSTV